MLRITFRDIRKIDPVGGENFRKNANPLVGLDKIGSKQWEFHPGDERMG